MPRTVAVAITGTQAEAAVVVAALQITARSLPVVGRTIAMIGPLESDLHAYRCARWPASVMAVVALGWPSRVLSAGGRAPGIAADRTTGPATSVAARSASTAGLAITPVSAVGAGAVRHGAR